MEAVFQDWLSLFFRWAHIIFAISWIGSSFFYMWLDSALTKTRKLPHGVKGENWAVHGGGFYHTQKYEVAPADLPKELGWFIWESYITWITGFGLMAITYYWGAKATLIDKDVMDLAVWQAISLSFGSLIMGWFLYDWLCKSPLKKYPVAVFTVLFIAVVTIAWGYGQLFSARAAWLHTGAIIATMMTGNVFLVIIPNTKIVVEDLKAGRVPDAKFGQIAKLRSTHNNYLTLPVIVMMISNHYPMAFGHPHSWFLIALILIAGAIIRVWFNLHEAGVHGLKTKWQWPLATLLMIGMMAFSTWRPDQVEAQVDTGAALALVSKHCATCHSASPAHESFDTAPKGVTFDSLESIRTHSAGILAQAVLSKNMPLGNETEMTLQERATLGAWLRAGAPE